MPPSKKSLFDTLVGTFVETSEGGSAPPCGSIFLTLREAEFHNLPPCGSKIRYKPEGSVAAVGDCAEKEASAGAAAPIGMVVADDRHTGIGEDGTAADEHRVSVRARADSSGHAADGRNTGQRCTVA